MFQIEEKHVGAITVLTLEGKLTSRDGSVDLARKLSELANQRHCALLLDCSRVAEIDSEGIGALVKGLTAAQKHGGALKLLNLSSHMQRVLAVLGILPVFETFGSEDRAVSSFH